MIDFDERIRGQRIFQVTITVAAFLIGAGCGLNLAPKPPVPKSVSPITINVTVQKPEQVKPTIEALSKSLPKLEDRR